MKKYMNLSADAISNRVRLRMNAWFGGILEYIATLGSSDNFDAPVIFIVGPPRSGSTLVMQVLTDAYKFAYLSNGHCRWFGAPGIVEGLLKISDKKKRSDYLSCHGNTLARSDPAECGAWWYRFFRRDPPYVTNADVRVSSMKAFRRSLRLLSEKAGKPLIFKNLYASLRLEPIAFHVPNALFVVIERDWVNNAQSILRARHDANGDYSQWWSLLPPNCNRSLRRSAVDQVVGQIESTHQLINRDIARLGLEDRTFRIRYEDFCANVSRTLSDFQAFIEKNGVRVDRRFDVPDSFPLNPAVKIPESMYKEVIKEVKRRSGTPVVNGNGEK